MPPDDRLTPNDQTQRTTPVESPRNIATEVQPDAPLPKPQTALIEAWRGISEQIVAYNARVGGGHLQNSVYRYAADTLKEIGADKQGWEVLPAQTGSALDMIGADIVLFNRRTGAMELLDPSSRRLDPKTGDFASSADNAKTNVPRLREPGVIDALPGWFDQSGRLERDQATAEMSQRVKEFAADFREKMKSMTSPGAEHPLNMRDFPMPTPTISKDKDKPAADIKKVIEYFNQRAGEERRRGDGSLAGDFNEYARTLERGAASFTARQESSSLETTVNKLAERVILEDAVRSLYPQADHKQLAGAQVALKQSSTDGSIVQVKPDGALVVTVKNPKDPGSPEVFTGGSATKAFETAATKLTLSAGHPERYAELANELPNHYKKMFAAGKLDMGRVLKVIGNFRAEYSAGGAGADRTLIGHLVHRLADRQPGDLRTLATGAAGAAPVAGARAGEAANQSGGGDGRPTVRVDDYRPAPRGEQREHYREAATPAQVTPPNREADRWAGRKPPEMADLGGQASDNVSAHHLSSRELQILKTTREELIAKGNLSPGEKQQVKNLERAERELRETSDVSPQKVARVATIRSAINGRGLLRSAGPAMLATVALNLYRNVSAAEADETPPRFGVGW